jgi:hypothetical protein
MQSAENTKVGAEPWEGTPACLRQTWGPRTPGEAAGVGEWEEILK